LEYWRIYVAVAGSLRSLLVNTEQSSQTLGILQPCFAT